MLITTVLGVNRRANRLATTNWKPRQRGSVIGASPVIAIHCGFAPAPIGGDRRALPWNRAAVGSSIYLPGKYNKGNKAKKVAAMAQAQYDTVFFDQHVAG